jgi:hypothetical protein
MTWTDPRTGTRTTQPHGPDWSYPVSGVGWTPPPSPPLPPDRFPLGPVIAALAALGMIIGFVATVALTGDDPPARARTVLPTPRVLPTTPFPPLNPTAPTFPSVPSIPPIPTAPTAPQPTDPDADVLDELVVHQTDVPAAIFVLPLPGGDEVTGQTTLDLCNAMYPSEDLRTARRQVVASDLLDDAWFSTEAVLYPGPSATRQAFDELQRARDECPRTPVVSPVGDPTVTTTFAGAPDAAWPQAASVERAAFEFTIDDGVGDTQHAVAVYLRRGRVLMGIYFRDPARPQIAVEGNTTIPAIVNVFARRMAALPADVVAG